MPDQTIDIGEVKVSPSIGVEDYFDTQDQTDTTNSEEVKADQTDKTGAETTKENDSESKNDDESNTEDKKTTETENEDKEDVKDTQLSEFEVAGTKYSTLDEAIKAVNRINGDNTRLSGDVKSLRKEKMELTENVSKLEKLLQDYKSANEEWQKYYDGDGERPDNTKADIEELIDRKVKEIKKSEKNLELKTQFDAEFDEIFAEEDFAKIEPFFKDLLNEYEGSKNPPSPKKLYSRAKIEYKESIGENQMKDLDSIEKMVQERVQRELAKKEAIKNKSNAGGAGKDSKNKVLPPEVADYFAQIM